MAKKQKCLCGCGETFVDTSPNQSRSFYERACRYKYLKKNGQYLKTVPARGSINKQKKLKSMPHRSTVCQGKGIDGKGREKGACDGYKKCFDASLEGGSWSFENHGTDCWYKS